MFFKQSLVPSKQQSGSRLVLSSVGAWDRLYDCIGHTERPDRGVILKTWHRRWGQSYFHLVSVGRVSSCSVCGWHVHWFPINSQKGGVQSSALAIRGGVAQGPKPQSHQRGCNGMARSWEARKQQEQPAMSREDESRKNLKLLLANTLR